MVSKALPYNNIVASIISQSYEEIVISKRPCSFKFLDQNYQARNQTNSVSQHWEGMLRERGMLYCHSIPFSISFPNHHSYHHIN